MGTAHKLRRTRPLPEALQRATAADDPWHGTVRGCDAADLATCLRVFGSRESHLALDLLVQVRLRCLRKQHGALVEAGVAAGVRAAMASHARIGSVQKLGREVLSLLSGERLSKPRESALEACS